MKIKYLTFQNSQWLQHELPMTAICYGAQCQMIHQQHFEQQWKKLMLDFGGQGFFEKLYKHCVSSLVLLRFFVAAAQQL